MAKVLKWSNPPTAWAAKETTKLQGKRLAVRAILNELADETVDDIRNTIASTPSGLVPGKPDRIWTGKMYDAVDRTPVKSEATEMSVEAGWLHLDVEDLYFIYQETGVDPRGRRKRITPMHAVLGAYLKGREELKVRIKALWR